MGDGPHDYDNDDDDDDDYDDDDDDDDDWDDDDDDDCDDDCDDCFTLKVGEPWQTSVSDLLRHIKPELGVVSTE